MISICSVGSVVYVNQKHVGKHQDAHLCNRGSCMPLDTVSDQRLYICTVRSLAAGSMPGLSHLCLTGKANTYSSSIYCEHTGSTSRVRVDRLGIKYVKASHLKVGDIEDLGE